MPAFEQGQNLFRDSQGEPRCRWLSADQEDNPFTIDGYDCLSLVNSLVAVTSNPEIARSFVALRDSEGLEYVDQLPAEAIEVGCPDLAYPLQDGVTEGLVFKASEMEEKWDVYLYGQRLYFCRSWTGTLVYVAEFVVSDLSPGQFPTSSKASPALYVSRIWVAGNSASTAREFVVKQADYLIKRFLLQLRMPHPLPPDLPRDPEIVGAYSFSQYGKMCCFGSFADTLPLRLVKPSWRFEGDPTIN